MAEVVGKVGRTEAGVHLHAGSNTTVRVGGGDRSETNQTAAVHGEMTWRVAAFDTDHELIALSDTAHLLP